MECICEVSALYKHERNIHMIRTIGIALLLGGFLIFASPLLLILYILKVMKVRGVASWTQGLVRGVFRLMLGIAGAKVTVYGLENIPKEGAVLFVSNHRSYFDILLGYGYTPKQLGFVAKKEMDRLFILRRWMEILNCLFLDRKDMKQGLKTILKGIEQIKQGISVWICPEGTRYPQHDRQEVAEFKEGALKMAEKSGCPVIPVAIAGTSDIFERHMPYVRAANVEIHYGKLINISELNRTEVKKLGAYTRDKIIEML